MDRTAQYLAAVYRLARDEGEPVPSGRVAEALDRSPATTTETLQRLDSEGLAEYEPYAGVSLTEAGRERGAERYRTYRTLRCFCRDVLGLDAYDREALDLVGSVSPVVAERLEETLLEPGTASEPEAAEPELPFLETGERNE